MKVICEGLDLSDAVLKVSKALAVKSVNHIIEGILLKAEGDSLTLTATDTELTIEKKIKADVLMEGETVVVGKYFVDFVKKLENEQVELSCLYNERLQIKYAEAESELQVFPADEFPVIDKNIDDNFFEIPQNEFNDLVEKVSISCSTEDSRPILKGCLLEVSTDVLTGVALDGYRMSIVRKPVLSSGSFKAIVPQRTLSEISKLVCSEGENLKVFVKKNSIFVKTLDTVIYSRLIEGEFVKYNHILPQSFSNTVSVNKKAFNSSIERAAIISRNDKFNVIRLDIKEDAMTITARSDVGTVNENINVNLNGKDITIAFNGKYLAEYLRIINEEYINLNLNSSIDSCVITPVGNEEFLYLLLPVRINS